MTMLLPKKTERAIDKKLVFRSGCFDRLSFELGPYLLCRGSAGDPEIPEAILPANVLKILPANMLT